MLALDAAAMDVEIPSTKTAKELMKPDRGNAMYDGTLQDYINALYNYFPSQRETFQRYGLCDYDLISSLPESMQFSNGCFSKEEIKEAYFKRLPSKHIIESRQRIGKRPHIHYNFASSTCILEAKCNICRDWISTAYTSQKQSQKQGFWTADGWLICRHCKKKNEFANELQIIRNFKFRGDFPRGRSFFMRYGSFSFNKTTDDLFRDEEEGI